MGDPEVNHVMDFLILEKPTQKNVSSSCTSSPFHLLSRCYNWTKYTWGVAHFHPDSTLNFYLSEFLAFSGQQFSSLKLLFLKFSDFRLFILNVHGCLFYSSPNMVSLLFRSFVWILMLNLHGLFCSLYEFDCMRAIHVTQITLIGFMFLVTSALLGYVSELPLCYISTIL